MPSLWAPACFAEETALQKALGGSRASRQSAAVVAPYWHHRAPAASSPPDAGGIPQRGHASEQHSLVQEPTACSHLPVFAPWCLHHAPRGGQPGRWPCRALQQGGCTRCALNLHLQLPWCGMWSSSACTSDHSCIPMPSVVTITTSTHVIKVITHTNWACDCMGISMIFLLS